MNLLHHRLAALRRRLRLVNACRGLCWLGAVMLGVIIAAGLLDWRTPGHLPEPVRALFLTIGLGAAALVTYRWLILPLAARADDLSLALEIESRHPDLKDSLASTVEFLGQEETGAFAGSATLRQAVVEKTMRQTDHFRFEDAIDTTGLRPAGLCFLLTAGAAVALGLLSPSLAGVAVARLALPYGGPAWPTQTQLHLVDFRPRIARGQPYDITCAISGIVPDTGIIDFVGTSLGRQTYKIADERLLARLGHMDRSFRFTIRVNDAVLEQSVEVLPPPVLVPLDGRASPQVRLNYPAYTDLPALDLPDGSGNIDAVAGTVATLRAAADRPLASAWIEYQPNVPHLCTAARLCLFGTADPLGIVSAYAASREVWARLPAQVGADGRTIAIRFTPHTSGYYVLGFEDESGLANLRLFDLRIFPDPAPAVTLERPSPAHDSLLVLPDAEVQVRVVADDPQFALRSVALEYRTHPQDKARSLRLYDQVSANGVLSALRLMGPGTPTLSGTAGTAAHLRPPHLAMDYRFALAAIRHPDGKALQPGNVVVLQAAADDFDDISLHKAPGRSQQVELRIVSPAALQQSVNEAQAQVQQELIHLRKLQQQASAPVIAAEQRWRNTGRINPRDLDRLIQAQQLQQQVRERVGTKPTEGLRGAVERILRTLKDNHVPRSGAQDRMQAVASEMSRLARTELPPIEPKLAAARKENENSTQPHVPAKGEKGPLSEARAHQDQVENSLSDLLKLLEPWGSLNELQGETRAIQQEQQRLHEQTRALSSRLDPGTPRDALKPEERTALDQTAEFQRKLQQRADDLLGKMSRIGQQRQKNDPEHARALQQAAKTGRDQGLAGDMKSAAGDLSKNQLNNALSKQEKSLKTLDTMARQLEQRREEELDRLRKKLADLRNRLDDLAQQQEQLRKKIKEAAALSDPKQRQEQLRRLARAQRKLRQQTQDMLQQLSRLRADQASQAMTDAADSMEQAERQLSRGENPDETQEETLDRLNEARRRLQQAQNEVEDELAREKLARVADQIKALKERQEASNRELERLRTDALQKKGWGREDRASLADLVDAQKGLGQETKDLAEGKLAGAHVFTHMLKDAAKDMAAVASHLDNLASGDGDDQGNEREAVRLQRKALRRFNQLLDALKSTGSGAARAAQNGQGGGGQPGGQGAGGGNADGIPQVAQLKALRNLQAEVNEDTVSFAKKHPDSTKLNAAELKQLQGLRESQREVGDLLDEVMSPAPGQGGKK